MARHLAYDETKSKELRQKSILLALAVLDDSPDVEKWSQYKKDLVMKLAPRSLPVLQEIMGKDGGAIEVTGININVRK